MLLYYCLQLQMFFLLLISFGFSQTSFRFIFLRFFWLKHILICWLSFSLEISVSFVAFFFSFRPFQYLTQLYLFGLSLFFFKTLCCSNFFVLLLFFIFLKPFSILVLLCFLVSFSRLPFLMFLFFLCPSSFFICFSFFCVSFCFFYCVLILLLHIHFFS